MCMGSEWCRRKYATPAGLEGRRDACGPRGVLYSLAEDLGDTMMIEAKLVVPREDRVFMRLEALRMGGP